MGGGGCREEDEESDRCGLEPVLNFTEAHSAYETVKSLFCAHCSSEHGEQNILNFEVALFCVKRKSSSKQLSLGDLFVKKKSDLCTHVNL
jgi:hypothetical protein